MYPPELVELVALLRGVCKAVTVSAERSKIVKAESYCRIVDILGR